ncbi:hypothetical protein JKF63_04924 [Porcisia hertigi]|uniref:Palmitoyltransferase n=1 Tax=Porcisia hertigi TaxID=2761500 RepID=A0A836LBV4_9TRYP|nr:hypothetical protein JKF63_04924 [Porcisia hertigi]
MEVHDRSSHAHNTDNFKVDMSDCRCLNVLAHPEPPKGCSEKCMMCCGYCTPAVIAILIVALTLTSDAYSLLLISRNRYDAWRIVVCTIVLILTTAFGALVLWSYYAIVFGSPGFVPRDPWVYPPLYADQASHPRCGGGLHSAQVSPSCSPHQLLPPRHPDLQQPNQEAARLPQTNSPSSLAREFLLAPEVSQSHTANSVFVSAALEHVGSATPLPMSQPMSSSAATGLVEGDVRDSTGQLKLINNCHTHPAQSRDGIIVFAGDAPMRSSNAPRSPPLQDGRHIRPSDDIPLPLAPHPEQSQRQRAVPPVGANRHVVTELDPKGCMRFCHVCQLYKPDYAHHCRVCRRCVYNFDHHCPFVNNCVGRNNYKLFLIFLLYSGCGASLGGGLMLLTFFAVDRDDFLGKVRWISVPVIDAILGFSLLLFYCQHRVLLCKGQSTLETLTAAGGDDAFGDFCCRIQKPQLPQDRAENARRQKEKVARHNYTLLGDESPWWRRYLPLPLRTDDTADDAFSWTI